MARLSVIMAKRSVIMAKLSVISYNCKGFNISKVPCIKILLDRCSVLLLKETWLFSNHTIHQIL